MTCCQRRMYKLRSGRRCADAAITTLSVWSQFVTYVACHILLLLPFLPIFTTQPNKGSAMKIITIPWNRVVIVVWEIAVKNGIVAGRSYYFAEGWTEPCGSSGHSDKAESQMHRGKTNLEFWWQKHDLYPSYTYAGWMEGERKTDWEQRKMRTLSENGK